MSSTSSSKPRRIEWTGERCVPWTDDLQVIYEHYQRYLFVAPLAHGLRVLDLASGEGYGTSILATEAKSVLGIDIDAESVLHATETYPLSNVQFQQGDMLDLSALDDGSFDLVVCFEALEHVEDHDKLMEGVTRILKPGGTFVVSTPDRLKYSEELGQENPFHVHELSRDEFEQMLGGHFDHVRLWGQNVSVGSLMMPLEPDGGMGEVVALSRDGDRWSTGPALEPTYLIAIASDSTLMPLPSYSTLVDPNLELVRDAMRERDEARGASGQVDALLFEVQRRESQELYLKERLSATSAELDAVFAQLERFKEHARHLEIHRAHYHNEVENLRSGRAYRIGSYFLLLVERILPPGSGRRRSLALLKRPIQLMRGVPTRRHESANEEPPSVGTIASHTATPLRVPTSSKPKASVIVPVHNAWDLTSRCLASLVNDEAQTAYEVIVVDDASTDATRTELGRIGGIQVLHLEQNLGFLRAVNAGAALAKGEYIVLLNNDVEVRTGWLDALVATADSDRKIGVVGAQLLYPDGSLQEAGSIIWSSATGWNYGRFKDPDNPSYTFRRDVDYASGACLLIRHDLWDEIGGFDLRFTPAYYEDADLAFSARSLGYRVVYEPRSRVVHDEGGSYGTDETPKKTMLMEANRKTFQEKWSSELLHHFPHDEKHLRAASWRQIGGRALVVDHLTPTFDQDAGSLRMFALLRMLTEMNLAVTFVPFNTANDPKYTKAVENLGVEVLHGPLDIPQLISELASDLRVAILSRPQVAWGIVPMLREFAPDAKIIYDTVDLHFLRERRRAEIEDAPDATRNAERYYEMELWLTRASDAVFVVSDAERELLAAEAPDSLIYVIPTIHQVEDPGLTYEARNGLLFVGSFNHPPNRDAVEWLTGEVLPIVRRTLPDVTTRIVGSNPPKEITDLVGNGVDVLGWVPDLNPLYAQSRLFVAPLRYGAGIRGKIGESAAHGLPVISTSLGAEGLYLRDGAEILLADEAASFAAAIVRAYSDPALWAQLATNSRTAIALQCSPTAVKGQLERAFSDLKVSV
jgi:GT2 family glycosyltransferase/SAM-dependent methyltransferase/glycosyltransferase involved in cell wall biosynthesis